MEKDIRFTDKKIDDSWKQQANREKGQPDMNRGENPAAAREPDREGTKIDKESNSQSQAPQSSPIFINFLTSLGYQVMIHLGDIENPETQKKEMNLEAAREVIDLLLAFKEKTQGNIAPEEITFFNTFLPELQMKFSQHV